MAVLYCTVLYCTVLNQVPGPAAGTASYRERKSEAAASVEVCIALFVTVVNVLYGTVLNCIIL